MSGKWREAYLVARDFTGQDGTTFSLCLVRPKTVRVKGKDLVGKTYDVAVPW